MTALEVFDFGHHFGWHRQIVAHFAESMGILSCRYPTEMKGSCLSALSRFYVVFIDFNWVCAGELPCGSCPILIHESKESFGFSAIDIES